MSSGIRALTLLFLVLVAASCASSSKVTLSRLAADQDRYVGHHVDVSGRVASYQEPDGSESYILEDADQNRVLLLPADVAAAHLGEQVEVTGNFDFDPAIGRILRIETIEASTSDQPT